MIKVNVVRDSLGFIWQFTVKGHAGYAEKGSDIICAAASVTAYTAVGALEEVAGVRSNFSEKDGCMICSIPGDISDKQKEIAAIILETTLIGFKQIELTYKEFLKVIEKRRCNP